MYEYFSIRGSPFTHRSECFWDGNGHGLLGKSHVHCLQQVLSILAAMGDYLQGKHTLNSLSKTWRIPPDLTQTAVSFMEILNLHPKITAHSHFRKDQIKKTHMQCKLGSQI